MQKLVNTKYDCKQKKKNSNTARKQNINLNKKILRLIQSYFIKKYYKLKKVNV